jgi:dihydroorotate dehydrogenase (NAD+) catalytic subunit
MSDLSVKIGCLEMANPVMVASGTFGYASEFEGLVDFAELGAIVTKTVTLESRPGNHPPRIAETPAGMLNSIGLPNVGVEAFIAEKMPYLRTCNTRIVVNVAGKTGLDYPEIVSRLEDVSGIDAYELNYSCPNVKEGGLSFSADARIAQKVTMQVRRQTRRPIIAKLTPNVTSISDVGRAVEQGGADAISAINTLVGMAVDIKRRKPRLSTITGGLSGPAIKPVALARVFELVSVVKIPVIGIGGIATVEDALEFLIVGAQAIQVGTANFYHPSSACQIARGLDNYCTKHRLGSITELFGSLRI